MNMQIRVYNRYRKQYITNGKSWAKWKFSPRKKDEVITQNGGLFEKIFYTKNTFRFVAVVVKKLLQFESGHGPKSLLPVWDRVNNMIIIAYWEIVQKQLSSGVHLKGCS